MALNATICMGQIKIKPALGINFTDFSKDPGTGQYKSQVGYQIGGSVAIGGKWYLEPGIYWTHKSTEYQTNQSNAQDIEYKMSGIRIPVAVGYNLLGKVKKLVNVRPMAGVSAFFLTGVDDLDKASFKTATWGLFAGAGADIFNLFMDVQYEWSLSKVSDTQVDVGNARSLFINVGMRFGL